MSINSAARSTSNADGRAMLAPLPGSKSTYIHTYIHLHIYIRYGPMSTKQALSVIERLAIAEINHP